MKTEAEIRCVPLELKHLADLCSASTYQTEGVRVRIHEGKAEFAAAKSTTIAVVSMPAETCESVSAIVPRAAWRAALSEGDANLSIKGDRVEFQRDDVSLSCDRLPGRFPNIEEHLPSDPPKVVAALDLTLLIEILEVMRGMGADCCIDIELRGPDKPIILRGKGDPDMNITMLLMPMARGDR